VRLARSGGGGVDYWLGLPIPDLINFLAEFIRQVREENEAADAASKRR
jgi:hypothetical protein